MLVLKFESHLGKESSVVKKNELIADESTCQPIYGEIIIRMERHLLQNHSVL